MISHPLDQSNPSCVIKFATIFVNQHHKMVIGWLQKEEKSSFLESKEINKKIGQACRVLYEASRLRIMMLLFHDLLIRTDSVSVAFRL